MKSGAHIVLNQKIEQAFKMLGRIQQQRIVIKSKVCCAVLLDVNANLFAYALRVASAELRAEQRRSAVGTVKRTAARGLDGKSNLAAKQVKRRPW